MAAIDEAARCMLRDDFGLLQVRERERGEETERQCVCVRERERGRERERELTTMHSSSHPLAHETRYKYYFVITEYKVPTLWWIYAVVCMLWQIYTHMLTWTLSQCGVLFLRSVLQAYRSVNQHVIGTTEELCRMKPAVSTVIPFAAST